MGWANYRESMVMFDNYTVAFENYYAAKKYYEAMVRCLNRYRICINNIIEIQNLVNSKEFIEICEEMPRRKSQTPEGPKEAYRKFIMHYEKEKYRKECHFQERYGVQTPEELEAKIREFELELKRLEEVWKLQRTMVRKGKK